MVHMLLNGPNTLAALVVLAASAASADIIYSNDFAERRSECAPRSVWATYEYDKGGPLAYDYDHTPSFDPLVGIYPWSGSGSGLVAYSQQDGWFKKNVNGIYNRSANRGRTSVTDEADPAMVCSMVDISSSYPATNTTIIVQHPLRNVFTNGIVKLQFDIRQPAVPTAKIFSWLRLVTEHGMKNDNNSYSQIPIELGLSSATFSGAWRNAGHADGTRDFSSASSQRPVGGNWYRYYVTCDIDSSRSSFEAYDLGASRIPMDAIPSGGPVWSGSNLLFVKELDDATGGISGIGIRIAYTDTTAYYGEEGFDGDAAYMYDNIKVAWKAPASQTFEECYRNDFARSMRRTVDGSGSTSHAYTLTEQDETSTFTYPDELVRAYNVGSQTGTPYLPAVSNGVGNTVQKSGVDGWRFVGESGYTGAIALTTNGANRVGMLTRNCAVIQPMCADVTSGLVKMEWDMRMPKGWNGNASRVSLILTSEKGYDEGTSFAYANRLLSLGFCSGGGNGDKTTLTIFSSVASALTGSYHNEWTSKFTALNWYRLQLFVNLDAATYSFNVYDLGKSAPATPDAFGTESATPLVSGPSTALYTAGVNAYGLAVGAYGFASWNDPSSDRDYAILFDNVRLWKGDGNDGWNLVFKNDFSTTTRNFSRKSLKLLKSEYIDRPEYGEDGWSVMPKYVGLARIAGGNPALYAGDKTFTVVHPIGRHIRSGKVYAQYDMRVPSFWTDDQYYFWFQFGNGALASASTWTANAYRDQGHRTIRTGMQRGSGGSGPLVDGGGVPNRTAIILRNGSGDGSEGTLEAKHINQDYVGHWIRMKIEADMGAKKWSCVAYDMGTAQPTLATADGTALQTWKNLGFTFNEPISYINIFGGKAPSYMPWRDDAPGALMVDNILVRHDLPGTSLIIR